MEETVDAEAHKKDELVKMATDAGLADAAKYANKAVIADAINRVKAGEDAAAVNAELAPDTSSEPDTDVDASDDKQASQAASKPRSRKIRAVNGGHPTQFDETGNPVYDPEQV